METEDISENPERLENTSEDPETVENTSDNVIRHASPHIKKGIGYFGGMLHVLKSIIATGIFAMGNAVCNAGLIAAPIGMLFLCLICVHCTHILLRRAKESREVTGVCESSFSETVEFVFKTGPQWIQKFSSSARICIDVCLCVLQIGTCCVYLEFVADNMKQVLDKYWDCDNIHIHLLVWTIPIMMFTWIPSMEYLVPGVLFGNLCQLAGVVLISYFSCRDMPPPSTRHYVSSWKSWPLFFGTALFTFEINSLALTIQCSMKKPEQFSRPWGVVNAGQLINLVLLIVVGVLGYLKYGDDVQDSLTLNMPGSSVTSPIMQVSLSLAVMMSYPLHMYVPGCIIWSAIRKRWGPWRSEMCAVIVVRTALVLTTLVFTETITQLGLVISLVGSVGSTAVSIVFPAILDIVYRCNIGFGCCYWLLWKDIFLLLFGVMGMATGIYATLHRLFEPSKK